MALLPEDQRVNTQLDGNDFTSQGEPKRAEDTTALVVGCAQLAEAWVSSHQYNIQWRDSDLLFGAPRALEVYAGTYVLAPKVRRFTVAKVVNAIVPQLYKGLFFDDPPMVLRPRPGTSQKVIDEKTAVASYLLDECQFKREVKWGLEHLSLFGTGIWKYGIRRVKKEFRKRVSTEIPVDAGQGSTEKVATDDAPKITVTEKFVNRAFFEFRPLTRVLVDPNLKVGDIREAGYVIDVRYMDFYEMKDFRDGTKDENGNFQEGWDWGTLGTDEGLKALWNPPVEAMETPGPLTTDVQTHTSGIVHHAMDDTDTTSADPLAKKLEVLQYYDPVRELIVLNRKVTIYRGKNQFKKPPFLSANWWNRPKAFYGMGIGMTVGENQQVDQGTINSILKILSFAVNPIYARSRDSNAPTQMIPTNIGRIITVDGEPQKAFTLVDTPKVPPDIWSALSESQASTESTTGADQTLVQGSSQGPRAGIGRSSAGANILANAAATRLDGPLDNFIDQVFTPFLYILDDLAFNYISDQDIKDILGEEMGADYLKDFDLNAYHQGKVQYEVLAGASMSARRTMAQSLPLIFQYFNNPEINNFLANMGLFIDWQVILNMMMEMSEWKDRQDVIKKMTPQMQQQWKASQMQQQQGQLQNQMALNQQKFEQRQELDDQGNQARVQRDLIREAVRSAVSPEVLEGTDSGTGFGSLEGA